MDRATILGLGLAAIGVLVGVTLEGGHINAFLSLSSFFIVIVGSFGAMVLSFNIHDVARFGSCLLLLFQGRSYAWEESIKHQVELATLARRNGVLALENTLEKEDDEFVRIGLRMLIDGADTDIMCDVLDARREALVRQARQDEKMFETLGGFMPTMGIVGTVTSLIHVLGNLAEPDKLGAGIASAFTATLYGVGVANLFVLPVGGKMRSLSIEEQEYYKMLQTGLVAVASGDNPLWVEQKMRAFIPDHVHAEAAASQRRRAAAATQGSKRTKRSAAPAGS